ncbi:MAG: tRNA (N6-threonylcarbamoyladenosine(37)-N6)-methyltransferase TrmO [Acidilobaceae archaeon]
MDYEPIGLVRTPFTDEEVKSSLLGVEGYIEVFEKYAPGLKGVEEYSHLIVVAHLHKVPREARNTLLVRPKRLTALGFRLEELPEVGVFATDSPHRPNPIAITIVELVKVEANRLYVKKLDLYDGTPVLDLKPYTPMRSIEESRLRAPWWVWKFKEKLEELSKI